MNEQADFVNQIALDDKYSDLKIKKEKIENLMADLEPTLKFIDYADQEEKRSKRSASDVTSAKSDQVKIAESKTDQEKLDTLNWIKAQQRKAKSEDRKRTEKNDAISKEWKQIMKKYKEIYSFDPKSEHDDLQDFVANAKGVVKPTKMNPERKGVVVPTGAGSNAPKSLDELFDKIGDGLTRSEKA